MRDLEIKCFIAELGFVLEAKTSYIIYILVTVSHSTYPYLCTIQAIK